MCPVGAGGLLEAEKSAGLLVDPSLAAQVVSGVLHKLLDDTTWRRSKRFYHLRIQSHQEQELQSQTQEKCHWALMKIFAPRQAPKAFLESNLTVLDHLDLVPGGRT